MSATKGTIPWNAGRGKGWTDKRGYRWLYVFEHGRRRARREHRVIMEKHLGRRLEPWEVVHHRDQNPSNNDISNLEIKTFGEHTAEHHKGSRRQYQLKKTCEAFAMLRQELLEERRVKSDLMAACEAAKKELTNIQCNTDGKHGSDAVANQLDAAIAKARNA